MSAPDIESIQVNLNSRFALRYVANSKSYCVFDMGHVAVPSQHHIHMSVVSATIPYSFYNVNNSNNLLMYTVAGSSYSLTIEPGNYNTNNLCFYLTQNMVSGFNVKYNSVTNKIMITNSSSDFSINSMSSCLEMLGLGSLNSVNKTIKSSYCCNMQTVESISIHSSSIMTGNFNSKDVNVRNVLCNIPITSQPNSNIVYESDGSKFTINLYDNILTEMTLKVCDHNGMLIDLNNCNWNITLQLDIVDFVN